MVRQRAGNQEGVGLTPSALPFFFFHFPYFHSFCHKHTRLSLNAVGLGILLTSNPWFCFSTPLVIYFFILFYFILFLSFKLFHFHIFILLFSLLIKKSKNIYFIIFTLIYILFLFIKTKKNKNNFLNKLISLS